MSGTDDRFSREHAAAGGPARDERQPTDAAAGRGSSWRPLPSSLGFGTREQRPAVPAEADPAGGQTTSEARGWLAQRTPSAGGGLPSPDPQGPWDATRHEDRRTAYPGAFSPGAPAPLAAPPYVDPRSATPSGVPGPSWPQPAAPPVPDAPLRSPYASSTQYLQPLEAEPPRQQAAPFGAAPASEFADEATEVYGEDSSNEARQVKGRLAVLEGELAGHWFTLLGSEIRVGRSDDNHLIIPDLAVSRHHVRLIYSQGAYRLQDLRSGNGTFVNGIHVEEATLRDGDQIELGRTILEFLTIDRAPGPVRFRRTQALPPGAPQPQALPAAAPRPLLPPAPGISAPPAVAPLPQAPLAAPLRTPSLAPPLATPAPAPAPRLPSMDFRPPVPVAPPAAAPAQRQVTPHGLSPLRRGMPSWAIVAFALLGLAILGLIGVIGYKVIRSGPSQPSPFARAHEAYQAGRWDEALTLMKAAESDKEHAAEVKQALQKLTDNGQRFQDAKALRAKDDLKGAADKLRQIPEQEPYASEAADLLAEVEAELKAKDAAKPKGPELTPGSPLDRALEPYRKERLADAASALRKLTKSEPQAAGLADRVDELLKELRAGRTLVQQKKPEEARSHLERAAELDQELGGALQSKIAPQLGDVLAGLTEQALAGEHSLEETGGREQGLRKFGEAGVLLQALRKVAPDHPKLASLNKSLGSEAKRLLDEAVQLKDATPHRARMELQAVMTMVPPDDPLYAKAKEELGTPSRSR